MHDTPDKHWDFARNVSRLSKAITYIVSSAHQRDPMMLISILVISLCCSASASSRILVSASS